MIGKNLLKPKKTIKLFVFLIAFLCIFGCASEKPSCKQFSDNEKTNYPENSFRYVFDGKYELPIPIPKMIFTEKKDHTILFLYGDGKSIGITYETGSIANITKSMFDLPTNEKIVLNNIEKLSSRDIYESISCVDDISKLIKLNKNDLTVLYYKQKLLGIGLILYDKDEYLIYLNFSGFSDAEVKNILFNLKKTSDN